VNLWAWLLKFQHFIQFAIRFNNWNAISGKVHTGEMNEWVGQEGQDEGYSDSGAGFAMATFLIYVKLS